MVNGLTTTTATFNALYHRHFAWKCPATPGCAQSSSSCFSAALAVCGCRQRSLPVK
ncbi:MAG: hypothetical protein IPG74_07855 [Flavobacteriales bacterium]|nr:hypothetical protein [Flavobacteriales bacterium]